MSINQILIRLLLTLSLNKQRISLINLSLWVILHRLSIMICNYFKLILRNFRGQNQFVQQPIPKNPNTGEFLNVNTVNPNIQGMQGGMQGIPGMMPGMYFDPRMMYNPQMMYHQYGGIPQNMNYGIPQQQGILAYFYNFREKYFPKFK